MRLFLYFWQVTNFYLIERLNYCFHTIKRKVNCRESTPPYIYSNLDWLVNMVLTNTSRSLLIYSQTSWTRKVHIYSMKFISGFLKNEVSANKMYSKILIKFLRIESPSSHLYHAFNAPSTTCLFCLTFGMSVIWVPQVVTHKSVPGGIQHTLLCFMTYKLSGPLLRLLGVD